MPLTAVPLPGWPAEVCAVEFAVLVPFIESDNGPLSFADAKSRLQSLVSAGDRGGAVSYFVTDVYGAPRAFVFAMPFLMPNAWKRNKLIVHTLP